MKNLISMTNFVLEQKKLLKTYPNYDKGALFERCDSYAELLKTPLKSGMFIPCGVDGEVLEKPDGFDFFLKNKYQSYDIRAGYKLDEYLKAKERCLFVWQDGFDYKGICEMFTDLEDIIHFEFKLTPLANKLLEAGI